MNNDSQKIEAEEKFNKAYKTLLYLLWTEKRIPKQLKTLLKTTNPNNFLELGCGLGYFTEYVENNGVNATGVDFSSIAIEKAKRRTLKNDKKPTFVVGDVTNLQFNDNQFDVILDIGCFQSLYENDEYKYAMEAYRVLKPNGTLLIWSFNKSFADNTVINSESITKVFKNKFIIEKTEFTRRRIIGSHWFWLKKC